MAIANQQYDASFWGAVDITPADGKVIETGRGVPFRGLYVGTAGNVTIRLLDGSTQTFTNVPAGRALQIQFDMVTSATASGLVGLF